MRIAKRLARQANKGIKIDAIVGDVVDEATAQLLTDRLVWMLAFVVVVGILDAKLPWPRPRDGEKRRS